MEKMKLKGIFAAMICPFDEAGNINEEVLRALVNRCLDGGCAGVVANGSTGEAVALTREERKRVVEICAEECHKRGKLTIAGTGDATTVGAVTFTQDAKDAGADAALVITPFNCIPNQEGLKLHYETVANVGLPIILYNIPSHTNVTIEMDTFNELAKNPMVIGMKESSGNIAMMAEITRVYGDSISVFTGCDDLILQIFCAGADAAVLGIASICPKEVCEVLDAVNASDLERARKAYYRILPVAQAIASDENFPACTKEAVAQLGFEVGACRMPILPAPESDKKMIHDALKLAELV